MRENAIKSSQIHRNRYVKCIAKVPLDIIPACQLSKMGPMFRTFWGPMKSTFWGPRFPLDKMLVIVYNTFMTKIADFLIKNGIHTVSIGGRIFLVYKRSKVELDSLNGLRLMQKFSNLLKEEPDVIRDCILTYDFGARLSELSSQN